MVPTTISPPKEAVAEPEKPAIQKAVKPVIKDKPAPYSKFSIQRKLQNTEEEVQDFVRSTEEEELPNNHFTETDLQTEWKWFLEEIQKKDVVIYNAISGFKLQKEDEDRILIHYPSDTAKSEFDKVSNDFLNHFRHKVNHYRLKVEFRMDAVNLKKEIVTKRSLFEKYVQINPVLRDLEELFKLDLN